MASRIVSKHEGRQPAKTKPHKRPAYRDFIHLLPCIITLEHGVECAHVNFENEQMGASGRGKGQKANDRFTLPLSPKMHHWQHNYMRNSKLDELTGERQFWKDQGIDPHLACLIISGLWFEDHTTAEQRATDLILQGEIGRI